MFFYSSSALSPSASSSHYNLSAIYTHNTTLYTRISIYTSLSKTYLNRYILASYYVILLSRRHMHTHNHTNITNRKMESRSRCELRSTNHESQNNLHDYGEINTTMDHHTFEPQQKLQQQHLLQIRWGLKKICWGLINITVPRVRLKHN